MILSMSRTYRNHSWGRRWFAGIKDEALGRDKKPGCKPPGWWKKIFQRKRRHIVKNAMRNNKEIPQFKNNNIWNWN